MFRLPAELRNQIYELVFELDGSTKTVELVDLITLGKDHRSDDPATDVRYSLPPRTSALMRSCQLVYAETRNMNLFKPAWQHYRRNVFWTNFQKNSFEKEQSGAKRLAFVPVPGISQFVVRA